MVWERGIIEIGIANKADSKEYTNSRLPHGHHVMYHKRHMFIRKMFTALLEGLQLGEFIYFLCTITSY
jgi:hypothetical protein